MKYDEKLTEYYNNNKIIYYGPSIIPVSYTHLDVYQRQLQEYVRKEQLLIVMRELVIQ